MVKQYGFLIDSERCVDCRACVVACKSAHNLELGLAWRRVSTTWKGEFPAVTFRSASMSCNHCAVPACVPVCPSGAIVKRSKDGVVVVNSGICVGCRACEAACPYHAPQFGKDTHMQKCDLCIDRIEAGKKPACISTCSAGAIAFGPMDELPALAGKRAIKQLEGASKPSIFVTLSGA